MNRYASVLFLAIFSLIIVVGGHGGDDLQTMRALSSLIDIPSSYYTLWNNTDKDPCLTWNGVVCSSSTNITSSHVQVTGLFLSGLGFYYSNRNTSSAIHFFDLICKLDSLESLDLSYNDFSSIPTAFFSNCSGLSQLKHLSLSSNILAGHLVNFSSFPSLEILDLSHNQLGGEVGPHLNGLINLKYLNLNHNRFTGTIPLYVGLEELLLSYNSFTGNIPNDIRKLKNLTQLDLKANGLYGSLPDGIGELYKLEYLDLSRNEFTGEVPSSLTRIQSLVMLELSKNQLSGPLPAFENRVHVFAAGNKLDLVLNGNHDSHRSDTALDRFFILVLPFVSGFIVSISLIRIVQEVILRCYYDDKYEPDASWRDLQPQALVRLENLRRIRQQLDAAHNRYAGAT